MVAACYNRSRKGEAFMYPCFAVIESVPVPEDRTHTFGIAMLKNGCLLDMLYDVTVRRADAEKIVCKLNQNRVAAIHFRDIIYDWITEQAML